MGKIKSAICVTLFTLLIAALCFLCTVSFSYGQDGVHTFNSVLRMTAKDADLGAAYGSDGYLGGGYTAVYYPEGVISGKEFRDNLGAYEEGSEEYNDYLNDYVPYANGTLYLEKESVCDGGTEPGEDFKTNFRNTFELVQKRYAALRKDGVRLDVRDDYTMGVFLPKDVMTNELYAFAANAFIGDFTVRYGSDADSAEVILPARINKTIRDYVKNVSSRTSADGTAYLVISFTKEGREVIKDKTSGAGSSSSTMFFMVAENSVVPLTVSQEIDQSTLFISGSYTAESASTCATVLNTVLKSDKIENTLELTVGEAYQHEALYGGNSLYGLYIAFGVCFVAMMVFFFVRYRALAFVHMYTYLIFLFAMILCVWSIPFLYLSTETFLAFLLASVVFSVSNVIVFEYARKEYALGKTIVSSVKTAYKRTFWHVFDLHIVIAALAFIVFGIGLTNLSAFAFVLGLGTVFSGFASLGLNRFMWAIMMAFTPKKAQFCNFKREEVEDDD